MATSNSRPLFSLERAATTEEQVRALAAALAYSFGRTVSTEVVTALAPLGFFSNRMWDTFAAEAHAIGVRVQTKEE